MVSLIEEDLFFQQVQVPTQDWVNVNINFRNTSRQIHFHTHKSNRLKIGMNMISNRFFYLNGKIELDWTGFT